MEKFCVFCGKNPTNKTNEHVIPDWLIKLTGDPKREIIAGINWDSGEKRKLAFNKFVFPACNKCNGEFSEMENQASVIVKKILREESLSSIEFNTLLIWFDKIRIGSYLAVYNFNKKHYPIKPSIFINGINKSDKVSAQFLVRVAK
ncbi:hypothetical protein AMJ80_08925 [bacterium SM23_31]|nr:MAG: hypothetical protein AMJ80_08925 [bacterium SM23_31]